MGAQIYLQRYSNIDTRQYPSSTSLPNSVPHAVVANARKDQAQFRDSRVHITHRARQWETVAPDTFGTGAHRITDLQNTAVQGRTPAQIQLC